MKKFMFYILIMTIPLYQGMSQISLKNPICKSIEKQTDPITKSTAYLTVEYGEYAIHKIVSWKDNFSILSLGLFQPITYYNEGEYGETRVLLDNDSLIVLKHYAVIPPQPNPPIDDGVEYNILMFYIDDDLLDLLCKRKIIAYKVDNNSTYYISYPFSLKEKMKCMKQLSK